MHWMARSEREGGRSRPLLIQWIGNLRVSGRRRRRRRTPDKGPGKKSQERGDTFRALEIGCGRRPPGNEDWRGAGVKRDIGSGDHRKRSDGSNGICGHLHLGLSNGATLATLANGLSGLFWSYCTGLANTLICGDSFVELYAKNVIHSIWYTWH